MESICPTENMVASFQLKNFAIELWSETKYGSRLFHFVRVHCQADGNKHEKKHNNTDSSCRISMCNKTYRFPESGPNK